MVEYICDRCDKKFTHSGDYKKHKARKLPCKIKEKCDKNITENTPKFEYKLEPFKLDIDQRKGHAQCIGLIMASGAGKTTLINHILKKYFKPKDYVTFMFASNLNSDIYKTFDKKIITTYDFKPEWITLQKKINQKFKNAFKFVNVLDDQVSNETKNDDMLRRLATSYRNSNINTIVTAQYNKMLSRSLRGNCKIMIFGHLNTDEDILDVLRLYLGQLFNGKTYTNQEKIEIYRKLTNDYQIIIYNTHKNTYQISKIKI